jgi:peptidoglycan/xylan/chitin deacetylase (PgdA/CDA1 family)
MGKKAKESLFKFARATKLFSLSRRITARKLRILCYHGIWLGPEHWGDFLFMSRERFTRRIEMIQSLGFNVISLADAVSALDTDALPENSLVITIDDGWYGSYLHMFPALKEAEMPFTVYAYTQPMLQHTPVLDVLVQYLVKTSNAVTLDLSNLDEEARDNYNLKNRESRLQAITKIVELLQSTVEDNSWRDILHQLAEMLDIDIEPLIEKRVFNLMTLQELAQVPSFGGTVELHTHTHKLEFGRLDQIRGTIEDNRKYIEQIIDGTPQHFCYPSGYHTPEIYSNLAHLDIRTATTTDPGFIDNSTNRLALPRICDGESTSEIAFEAELCGALELKRVFSKRIANYLR